MTSSSFTSKNGASISARRSQLSRQNDFGKVPNRFMGLFYWLKDMVSSPDTTDEKITSTVLVSDTPTYSLLSCIQDGIVDLFTC